MERKRRKLKVENIYIHDDPKERQAALQKIAEQIALALYYMDEQKKAEGS